jgi:DNA-binding NarL/FixJ family response regulator
MDAMISFSIVDDDKNLRQSIANFVNRSDGFRCVSSFGSGEAALKRLPAEQPDVVLMDINMAGMNGIECAQRLKTVAPGIQIVMLTVYEDTEKIFKALAAGATGYLLKRLTPAKLLQAIREVHEGGSPMSGSIARKLVASLQTAESSGPRLAQLSPREQMILERLAKGLTYQAIADELGISVNTIRSHLRRVYEKLHVQSRTEAVVKYLGAISAATAASRETPAQGHRQSSASL